MIAISKESGTLLKTLPWEEGKVVGNLKKMLEKTHLDV